MRVINKDLTIVKSVKQYKSLKNGIYKWETPLKLSNISLIVVGLFFLIIALLELAFETVPLFVYLSVITEEDQDFYTYS